MQKSLCCLILLLYFFYIIPSKCHTATLESVNHFPCQHSANSENTLHKVPATDLSREAAEEAGGKPGVAAPPQVEEQKTFNLAPGDDVMS